MKNIIYQNSKKYGVGEACLSLKKNRVRDWPVSFLSIPTRMYPIHMTNVKKLKMGHIENYYIV